MLLAVIKTASLSSGISSKSANKFTALAPPPRAREVVTSDNHSALKIVLLPARPRIIRESPLNITITLVQ